jgi:superfamily I DNA/RNA helicase
MLCCIDHQMPTTGRRKIERHPRTGAAAVLKYKPSANGLPTDSPKDYNPKKLACAIHRSTRCALSAIQQAGIDPAQVSDRVSLVPGAIVVSTMHLAKGLEFRAVAVMACDDELLPLQNRIENVSDESDLEEVYNTERHLLYVA